MHRMPPCMEQYSTPWMVPWLYRVGVYLRVRRTVMVDGMSVREVSRVFRCKVPRCPRYMPIPCRHQLSP